MTIGLLRLISKSINISKGNQAMKVDQLIEYNVSNIFFRKRCRKRGRKTSPTPLFFKKSFI